VFGLIFKHASELETEKDARKRKKTVRQKGRGRNGVVSGSGRTPSEFSPTVRVSLLTWRTEPYIAFIVSPYL